MITMIAHAQKIRPFEVLVLGLDQQEHSLWDKNGITKVTKWLVNTYQYQDSAFKIQAILVTTAIELQSTVVQ